MTTPHYVEYDTPQKSHPRTVCFTTSTRNNKHYVTYGAVTGSKRVRRQLDMSCSLPVYENTLKQIAEKRRNRKPIEAEFCVLKDQCDMITTENIRNSLQNNDENCIQFWEHNIMLFGNYSRDEGIKCENNEHFKSYLNTYLNQIKNNDVIRHRFHKTRPSTDDPNLFEHMFSIVCRFQVSEDNNILIYGTHIQKGKKRLSITEKEQVWISVHQNLLNSPRFWFSIPDCVHFNRLCELDGWS